jgi:prepilin-type N-terminal cleavage/methylation domain-containing protein
MFESIGRNAITAGMVHRGPNSGTTRTPGILHTGRILARFYRVRRQISADTCRRPQPDEHDRQQGFTLIEVLVTLVLLGLVAATVFGSLRQVLEARVRLRPYLDQSQETALAAGWFRQTVHGLIADYPDAKDRFTATADQFSGLSASPLAGPAGTPAAFRWVLRYDADQDTTVLEYGEGSRTPMRIAAWPGRQGTFAYCGSDQKWRSDWPPAPSGETPVGTIRQLPALVRLGGIPPDVFPTIIAATLTSPLPRPLPLPLLSGS